MKFVVKQERIEDMEWDQAIALEEMATGERVSLRALKEVLATFLVDDEGKYLDAKIAQAKLGKLKVGEIRAIGDQFAGEVKNTIIPPANGGS